MSAFFKISYGLYIVSSNDGTRESGFIGNAVMQITAEPQQLLVASNKNNFTTEIIQQSKKLTISVLSTEAKNEFIGLFGYQSGRNINKFEKVKPNYTSENQPYLTEKMVAWFACNVVETIDVGTHLLFVCSVSNAAVITDEAQPMTYDYFHKVLKGKSPKNAPTFQDPTKKQEIETLIINKKEEIMNQDIYVCDVCGYEYDPATGDTDNGVAPGTSFDAIPEDWDCPLCGVDKTNFTKL